MSALTSSSVWRYRAFCICRQHGVLSCFFPLRADSANVYSITSGDSRAIFCANNTQYVCCSSTRECVNNDFVHSGSTGSIQDKHARYVIIPNYNFHSTFTSPEPSQVKCNIYVAALHINTAVSFKSNITKNYYCWPPPSILLILFEKNICILDLLRILVWDIVANARNVNSFLC